MSIIILLFLLYGNYVQSSSIEKSIKNDAGVISELVFQNLYTIMKNGGTKEDMTKVIIDLEKKMPNVNISVFKSPTSVNLPTVTEVFSSQVSDIVQENNHLYFASPILYKQECLECHRKVSLGETAAVILIEYPLLDLQISLREILVMVSILFIITVAVFFSIWYLFLKRYFVSPIKSLVKQMKSIVSHDDLEKSIFIDTSIKEVKQLEYAFNHQNKELITSYNNLELISNTDSLTGIYNRKKFDEYTSIITKDAKRYQYNLSLVIIDLNGFKIINDTYGHQCGDEVLILFTKLVSDLIRESDFFFRTGGDEFILLLPHTSSEEAQLVINKILDSCQENKYVSQSLTLIISASFGIAQYGTDGEEVDELIRIADERMYLDKKSNKN